MPEPSTRRRRRLVLGLRGLMLAVLVIGGVIGWFVYRTRVQREAVAAIQLVHGSFNYDIGDSIGNKPDIMRRPPPRWLYDNLGPDYFGNVIHVGFGADPSIRADDALMFRIGRLDRLTELHIRGKSAVTGAGLAQIRGLTLLRYLNLEGTSIDGPSLVHLRRMTALQELFLPNDVSDTDLVHIAGKTNLSALSLSGPKITDAGLAHLAGLTSLNELTIRCPGVKGPGLAHLRGMTKLDRLDLERSGVDDLSALPPLPILRVLSLEGTPMSDAGLARAAGLSGLSLLDLTDSRVGDAGLAYLAGLGDLEWLCLAGTRITDAGLAHLVGLRSLDSLYLGRTAITDAGLAHVARISGPLVRIPGGPPVSLGLAHTKITDAGLPILRSTRRFNWFDLEGTAVTPAGFAAFKAALPPGATAYH